MLTFPRTLLFIGNERSTERYWGQMTGIRGMKMHTTAIIPSYNAARTIGKVAACARWFCDDVIVVDDGSTDSTSEVASKEGCCVHRFEVNRGKAEALRLGMRVAISSSGKYLVTLDADGEHDPTDIPSLLEPLKRNSAVVVFGVRGRTHSSNLTISRPTQAVLTHVFGLDVKDAMCGFRAYTSNGASRLLRLSVSQGFGIDFELALLTRLLNLPYEEVAISTAELQVIPGVKASHFDSFASNLRRFAGIHRYDKAHTDARWLRKMCNRDSFSVSVGRKSFCFSFDENSGLFVRS